MNATATQAITLDQGAGDLTLGTVNAGGTATLTSAGAILDGDAASMTALTAPGTVLAAGSGIGTATSPIQAQVQDLAADAGSGGLWINNSGSLTINDSSAVTGLSADGALSVTTSGALTVAENITSQGNVTLSPITTPSAGEDFTLNPGVIVQSLGGTVAIDAAGNVTLSATGTVSAAGAITIQADTSGTVAPGATVNISGTLMGTSASVTTGPGNDSVFVHQLPIGTPLAVNTDGGNDLLSIDGTSGNDTFTITGTAVNVNSPAGTAQISYSNVASLDINAKPNAEVGNDSFVVNGTSAALLSTINAGNGTNTLVVNASTSGGLTVLNAPLLYNGGSATDAVTVNGSGNGDTYILSNEPKIEEGEYLVGGGLQFQYINANSLTLNMQGGNNTVDVLDVRIPTVVTTGTGNNSVNLGGNPALPSGALTVPVLGNPIYGVTAPQTLDGFTQTFSLVGGSGVNMLGVDTRADQSTENTTLTSSSLLGLGETQLVPGTPSITFSGISGMTLDLGTGGGNFTVMSTITASSPNAITINSGSASQERHHSCIDDPADCERPDRRHAARGCPYNQHLDPRRVPEPGERGSARRADRLRPD